MAPTTMAPIFIVGVPRSGTTLLAAMLNAHPRIAISPETFFFEWALRRTRSELSRDADFDGFWRDYTRSRPFADLRLDAEELRRRFRACTSHAFADLFAVILESYAGSVNKPRCGEKTPRHYLYVDTILEWFPRARVAFVVRDPRAVAASLLLVPWASDDAEEHGWRWRRSIELLTRFEADSRVIATRYEDLVSDPKTELARLCSHIGEPFDNGMLDFAADATALVAGESHKQNVLRPLEVNSLHKWKHQLTAAQTAAVEHIAADGMAARGYEPTVRGLGLGGRVAVQARRLTRQAGRVKRRALGVESRPW